MHVHIIVFIYVYLPPKNFVSACPRSLALRPGAVDLTAYRVEVDPTYGRAPTGKLAQIECFVINL